MWVISLRKQRTINVSEKSIIVTLSRKGCYPSYFFKKVTQILLVLAPVLCHCVWSTAPVKFFIYNARNPGANRRLSEYASALCLISLIVHVLIYIYQLIQDFYSIKLKVCGKDAS